MVDYDYLIVGGGMTAAAAVKGIRDVDLSGSIGILSAEPQRPYKRPPLTKKLWMGKPEDIIWLPLPEDRLDIRTSSRVTGLDLRSKVATLETGEAIRFGRLLLATGGTPRRLPFGDGEVLYYRTFDDYRTLRSWTGKGARLGVIGGGFIGSELAAALASNGERVVMVFPEAGVGASMYPPGLTDFVTGYYHQKGVEVWPNTQIAGIRRQSGRLVMTTQAGDEIEVDHIVAGLGITPNTGLAEANGVALAPKEGGGGIRVDEHLETNREGVFAAGDVAAFYNAALERVMRVEHEDNANTMGYIAGLNLAGQATPYRHQPYFYSDLFELGYEAVGELSSRMETYSDWKAPFREGVVYYLRDRTVRGVLLWNTWGQVEAARQLIAARQPVSVEDLKERIGG